MFRLADRADKTKALAAQGFDQALSPSAARAELMREVRANSENDSSVPDRSHQIVLADDAVAAMNEEGEKIEDLRLDRDQFGPAAQFAPTAIEHIVLELILQGASSGLRLAQDSVSAAPEKRKIKLVLSPNQDRLEVRASAQQ